MPSAIIIFALNDGLVDGDVTSIPCSLCCCEGSIMSPQPWQARLSFSDRLSAVMKMQVNPEMHVQKFPYRTNAEVQCLDLQKTYLLLYSV